MQKLFKPGSYIANCLFTITIAIYTVYIYDTCMHGCAVYICIFFCIKDMLYVASGSDFSSY